MIPLTGKSLKKAQKSPFSRAYRSLLYDSTLSYGARCFGLARLDIPTNRKVTQGFLGRKLGVGQSQSSIWHKELRSSGYDLAFGIPEAE
jgi:hypothetical protein